MTDHSFRCGILLPACFALASLGACQPAEHPEEVQAHPMPLAQVGPGTHIRCVQTESSTGIPDIDFFRLDGEHASIWLVNGERVVNQVEHENALTGEGSYDITDDDGSRVHTRFTLRLNLAWGRLYMLVHRNGGTIDEPGLPGRAACRPEGVFESA